MRRAPFSVSDPRNIVENLRSPTENFWLLNRGYRDTNAKIVRTTEINPALKTLVLIIGGQSNACSVATTSYTPTNASAVDNFNIYDANNYAAAGVLLGCSWLATSLGSTSLGHIGGRIADPLITNGDFDRAILVPYALGGTSIGDWMLGGPLFGNHTAVMKSLAVKGIIPGMTGVTFAHLWLQGESDSSTTQAAYQAGYGTIVSQFQALGFNGKFWITQQTRLAGVNNNTIRAAQLAVCDGTTVNFAGDADAQTSGRYADGTHWDDTAIAAIATTISNSMAAVY